jgi:hypothetical protein
LSLFPLTQPSPFGEGFSKFKSIALNEGHLLRVKLMPVSVFAKRAIAYGFKTDLTPG